MNVLEYLVKPKQQKETLCSTVPSGNSSITSLDFVGLLPTYQIYTEERMPSKKKKNLTEKSVIPCCDYWCTNTVVLVWRVTESTTLDRKEFCSLIFLAVDTQVLVQRLSL